eukprot:m.264613 g.264613  ORF g.264613 m.264613 type:complete len:439 (-) comp57191_c0_seq1:166-1482(-)
MATLACTKLSTVSRWSINFPSICILYLIVLSSSEPTIPLFITFDSGISVDNITHTPPLAWTEQEVYVWGATADADRIAAWRKYAPNVKLSYYMPYSRAPAASEGFDLDFWTANHPDWVLYRCDRKTVAFWDGETAKGGSVPLDFTNPDVIAWQVNNQSVTARNMGFDAMAFDNYGGGARQGANSGQACGVFARNGSWIPVFTGKNNDPTFVEASLRWLETVQRMMSITTPTLGIIPNICIDEPTAEGDWGKSAAASRVASASTGILSERGFTGWGGGRASRDELVNEYEWMHKLSTHNKSYYSINEVQSPNWNIDWIEWVIGAFLIGIQEQSALWLGTVQNYGGWSYTPQLSVDVGFPSETYENISSATSSVMLFRRNFTKGIVFLNPDPIDDGNVFINCIGTTTFVDLDGNPIVCNATLTVRPQHACVLRAISSNKN